MHRGSCGPLRPLRRQSTDPLGRAWPDGGDRAAHAMARFLSGRRPSALDRDAEFKFQLSELQITYGPEHPNIIQQKSWIAQASIVPPELTALRDSDRRLLTELANMKKSNHSPHQPQSDGRGWLLSGCHRLG